MKVNYTAPLLVVCFLAVTVFSLPQTGFSKTDPTKKPVVIGVPLPFSGGLQGVAALIKNSMEMAKDAVNGDGGINGHPLKLEYGDNSGEIEEGRTAVRELVTQANAVMLLGGYRSNPTFHMAALAEELDIPFLISGAAADNITQQGWQNIFRINSPVSEYALNMEDFWVRNVKPKSMAIIYEDSMYGTDGATHMTGFCRDHQIQVTNIINYDRKKASESFFQTLLSPLVSAKPDIIYMLSELEDGVTLVKTIRALKINALLCGGGAGFAQTEFLEKAGSAADFLLTVALWNDRLHYPRSIAYTKDYEKRFGSQPTYHGAQAYAAVMVAADALKRSLHFTSDYIRAALNRTLLLKTPIGPIKFFNYGKFERQNSIRTQVLQIYNGKFDVIWPLDLATGPYIPQPSKIE